jgi:NTP-dependent ternary system trypsin peptidase co-occuring protein
LTDQPSEQVLVQVVSVQRTGEIGWARSSAQRLADRLDDIRKAIADGASAVATSLPGLPTASGWGVNEATVTFGVTLTGETGVLIGKAGAAATFEVSVTWRKADAEGDG